MDMMSAWEFITLGKKMPTMLKEMKDYGKISIEDFANRFSNPLLAKLMTDFTPLGYLASTLVFSHTSVVFGNDNIPLKGSLAMTNRIIDRYKKLGGILHTNTEIINIDIDKNRAAK